MSENTTVRNIDILKAVFVQYYPDKFLAYETALSVVASSYVAGISQPIPVIFRGVAGSRKSTILEIVHGLEEDQESVVWVNNFTSKAFASAAPNRDPDDDLLPEIKGKTMITPELGTLFRDRGLKEKVGILLNLLDGKGFSYRTGMNKVEYIGNYRWNWLGGIVSIPPKVWEEFGTGGPRFNFHEMESQVKTLSRAELKANLHSMIHGTESANEVIEKLRNAQSVFFQQLDLDMENLIVFDGIKDEAEALDVIDESALLVGQLRRFVTIKKVRGKDVINLGEPEDPQRAGVMYKGIAMGHAVISERNYITIEDVRIIVKIAIDSAPGKRGKLFRELVKGKCKVTIDEFMRSAGISRHTALKEFEIAEAIGLVTLGKKNGGRGRPRTTAIATKQTKETITILQKFI
tara:strand:- start:409 stop:1623 length:1215 start_codon:yes stop_codon:yes gene_type:complete